MTRRHFAGMAFAGLAALSSPLSAAGTAPKTPADKSELFYIGMQGEEIRAGRLDPATGDLTLIGAVAKANRPFWLVRHPALPLLYSVADTPTGGTVTGWTVNRTTGALTRQSEAATGGGGPTHLWLDAISRTLLVAHYGTGSVSSIALKADGSLGERLSVVQDVGTGPTPRQRGPHAHGIALAPGGRFALVSDLGADRLFVYPFDRKTGKLSLPEAGGAQPLVLPAGSGPRHVALHPNGRFVYLINELTANIVVLGWNRLTGALTEAQVVSTDAPGFDGLRSASEIHVSADGQFLYSANRSDGAMLVYRVDQHSGKLTQLQRIAAGGPQPWAYEFNRTGRWLVVTEQASGKLVVFAVNPRTGLLAPTGKTLDTPKPVAITFVR